MKSFVIVIRVIMERRPQGWVEHAASMVEKFTTDDGSEIRERERDIFENFGVNGIIILKLIVKKLGGSI